MVKNFVNIISGERDAKNHVGYAVSFAMIRMFEARYQKSLKVFFDSKLSLQFIILTISKVQKLRMDIGNWYMKESWSTLFPRLIATHLQHGTFAYRINSKLFKKMTINWQHSYNS